MKFKLSTTGYFYPQEDRRKKLSELGFTFKPSDFKEFSIEGNPEIEIETLDELMDFTKKYGEIIIDGKSIEIYDDYRE